MIATNRAKAAGNRKGKQFVKQPKKIAKKTAVIQEIMAFKKRPSG